MSWRLLLIGLCLSAGLSAAAAEEKLAGEDVAVPTAVPTPMDDERGPVQATRTAQAASSFDLPAFVVTGTGERQSLARRQDLSGALDTSGGIKASPGEQGAGKDQLEAQAERESLDSLSGTSRPWAGGLRLGAGYQPGYEALGYLAQELGPWFWSLDGGAAYSEGGPIQAPMRDAALSDDAALRARAGWRGEGGWTLSGFAEAGVANRAPQPYLAGQTAVLRRQAVQGGLEADGQAWGLTLRQRAAGGHWTAALPGVELSEDQAGFDLDLSRRFSGRTGSTLLEAALGVDSSSLAWAGQRRSRTLLRGSLLSRFDVFKGSRLGLGLALDAVSGDDQALLLGPLLRWDQRLVAGLSLQVAVDSGLRLSRLKPAAGGAGQAWQAPDPSLKPARVSLDGRADLHWQAGAGWRFSLGAFSQEGEDWFLPAASPQSVMAVDTAVRGWRLLGLRAQQSWRKDGWWQSSEAVVQRAELTDLNAWATLLPLWSANVAGGFKHGPWKGELNLALLGPRHGALDGSLPLEPSADLGALLSYDLDAAWTFFAEGRNLAVQRVQVAPSYPQAAPYAGLGVEYRF